MLGNQELVPEHLREYNQVWYKEGYKYQTTRDYVFNIGIVLEARVAAGTFLRLDEHGNLWVKAGYAWDGASGPTWDTPNSMRASLVHDALYQLMRYKVLDPIYRAFADDLFGDICVDAGMLRARAALWEKSVHLFGEKSADPASRKPVLIAP